MGAIRMGAGVEKQEFGKTADGTPVELYTLTNANGLQAKVMTLGAILTELHVPDRQGKLADVVLGFSDLESYLKGHPHFGSTIGRFGNRIAKGRFTLDGKEYKLAINNGPNSLHGGLKGFDKMVWQAEPVSGPDGPAVILAYRPMRENIQQCHSLTYSSMKLTRYCLKVAIVNAPISISWWVSQRRQLISRRYADR